MKPVIYLLPLAPLAACTMNAPESTPPPPPANASGGKCDSSRADELVGQKATAETGARALQLTGARTLRWGPPRSAFTMDYREDRVNVMYDDAMTIIEVTCG
jgi:hypothetical protein